MSFGRTDDEFVPVLSVLDERELGAWPETDTPDVGERYIVERMLGKQPQLQHETVKDVPKPSKPVKVIKKEPEVLVEVPETIAYLRAGHSLQEAKRRQAAGLMP
jgi:hypothetical protein